MHLSQTMFNYLSGFVTVAYLAGALTVLINIINSKDSFNPHKVLLGCLLLAILGHSFLIFHSYTISNSFPFDFFNALSLVSLVISGFFFIATITRSTDSLSIVILPFLALAVALNTNNEANLLAAQNNASSHLQVHIVLSILAYSLLTVAAFQAILLSFQERALHNRQSNRLMKALPPLQQMEQLLFQALSLGVILLTFALASGFLFIDDIFGQHLAHKTTLSIFAWLVFSTLLWGRYFLGWRGQKVVKLTYGGYLALMLAYFGSKFVLQIVLG